MFPQFKAYNAEQGKTSMTARTWQGEKKEKTLVQVIRDLLQSRVALWHLCFCVSPNIQETHTNKQPDGLREETRLHNCRKGVNRFLWRL